MNDIVIQVQNLSKYYRLGLVGTTTLEDDLHRAWAKLRGKPDPTLTIGQDGTNNGDDHIWALKDISFEVKQGEILGIIGRNGAGKSTLLKILSRVTAPTSGECRVKGRIASLLEVGTGFHPELTGRENIFLNGAILGMTKEEIRQKFDEIVDFSGVEKFIDTPVKRYSSGMYVRLAFAVAAHLEPEILVVDEVLAVGDAAFQKKCLGKMDSVAREGRTVLFVSHSMPSIVRLCGQVCLLDDGKLFASGMPHQVVNIYLKSGTGSPAKRVWGDIHSAPGGEVVRLRKICVHTEIGEDVEVVDVRQPIGIDIEYWNLKEGSRLVPNLHFFNEGGLCIFISTNNMAKWYNQPHPKGLFKSTCWIPGNLLSEGLITVTAAVSTINPTEALAVERDAISFQVKDDSEGDGARGQIATDFPGVVRPLLKWTMAYDSSAQNLPVELNSSMKSVPTRKELGSTC